MDQAQLDELIEKVQMGEATEAEELELLQEISFSYDILKKYLKNIRDALQEATG
ncbi:hypothetical protein K2Q02_00840 [Patescibacteria group bacterium]|nr:hypothetical protein [Patescibacteria group bacterium]